MPYLRNKRTGETIFVPDQAGARPIGPQDPYKVKADNRADRADARADRAEARADATAFKPTPLGNTGFMFDPKTGSARPIPGFPPKKPKTDDRLTNLRALEAQIQRVEQLYKAGPGSTKGLSSLLDYLPTPTNSQFDTASAGIGDVAFNAFRTPGAGAQSDAELKARLAATQPNASDYDATIQEKLNYLKNRLNASYQTLGVKRQSPSNKARTPKGKPRVINFNDLPE